MKLGPGEFFETAHQDFLSKGPAPRSGIDYAIGDQVIRVEIRSDSLTDRMTGALAHLELPEQPRVDLTIHAWDTARGGMLSPPWSESAYGPRGEIHGFNTERFRTAFAHGSGALSMIDFEGRRALFWTRDADCLPAYESAAPWRSILGWWMERNHHLLIHAGLVARDGSAVILAGPGGSGKSTTALLCLQAGWKYLGDDYCLLQPVAPVRGYSLYNSAKIARAWLHGVPQLKGVTDRSSAMHADKHLLFLNGKWSDHLLRSAGCKALFLPQVVDQRETTVEKATPAEALRALAPSSIFQTAAAGAFMFAQISALVQRLPIRRLNLGRDLDQIPPQMQNALAGV